MIDVTLSASAGIVHRACIGAEVSPTSNSYSYDVDHLDTELIEPGWSYKLRPAMLVIGLLLHQLDRPTERTRQRQVSVGLVSGAELALRIHEVDEQSARAAALSIQEMNGGVFTPAANL